MRASLITRITWLALAASLLMTLIIALFIGFFSEHARQHHRHPDWRAMKFIARQIYERPTAGRIERMAEEFGVDLRYHNGQSDFEYTSDGGMPNFDEVRKTRRKSPPGMIVGRVGDTRVIVHTLGPHRLMAFFEDRLPEGSWRDASGIIAVLAAALAILWSGFYFMQWRLLAPLKILRDDMQKAGKGEWRTSPIVRQDEIGELATAFNDMQNRLCTLMEAKGRFLADASHELRSPLARLRVAAEFIADEKLRTRMTTDIAELDSLSAEILEKTRLESHLSPLVKTPLNVDELLGQLRDVTDDVRVVFELNAPQTIAGDAKSLGRAVGNLLNNATKFADKKVLLKSEMRDGAVWVSVSDDGAGAGAADLPHLFEPFYRADWSRSRDTGGFGMGLAIVQAAVTAHGGTATAKNNPDGGLSIILKLPLQ